MIAHRKIFDTAYERTFDKTRLAGQFDMLDPCKQFAEEGSQLEARQILAEADMRAGAEGERIWVLLEDMETARAPRE